MKRMKKYAKIFSITKKVKMKKLYCVIENLRKLKYHTSWKKTLFRSTICRNCKNKDEKMFREEESIEILTILGLIENI